MRQMVKSFLAFILGLFLSCCQALSPNKPVPEDIASSITELAIKLNKLFYQPSSTENVLFSPLNIYSALALVHLAANSTSRSEVRNLLEFPKEDNNQQKSHEALSQILKTVQNTRKVRDFNFDPPYGINEQQITNINIANGIFVQKGMNLKPSYISQVQSFYKGEVTNLDFANDGSKATDTINQYISKNTKGKIENAFSEPLPPNTRLILASVLYFKAIWQNTFSESYTEDASFNTGSGTVNVKMMSNFEFVPYINLPELKVQAIELYYADQDTSMIIILPNVDQSLHNVIQSLDSDVLNDIAKNLKFTYVDYKIPKTKFGWSSNIDKHIQNLGVKQVFSDQADLNNMLTSTKLKISEITHTTEIEINEIGTEASAVTVPKMVPQSALEYPVPIEFIVNRPFIFYILHRPTNTILFLGSVKNPNEK